MASLTAGTYRRQDGSNPDTLRDEIDRRAPPRDSGPTTADPSGLQALHAATQAAAATMRPPAPPRPSLRLWLVPLALLLALLVMLFWIAPPPWR